MRNAKLQNDLERLRRDFEEQARKYHDLTLTIYFVIKDHSQEPIKAKDPHHAINLWHYIGNATLESDLREFLEFQQTNFGPTNAKVTAIAVIEGQETKLFQRMAERAGSLLKPLNIQLTKLIMDNFADPEWMGKPVFGANSNPLSVWLNLTLMCVATFQPGRFSNQTLAVDPFTASLAVFDNFLDKIDETISETENFMHSDKQTEGSENKSVNYEYRGSIEVVEENVFDWNGLQELWQSNFGGRLLKIAGTETSVNFVWTNPNIEEVVKKAEIGLLDANVKHFKGEVLTELFNPSSECIYQFVPTIDLTNHTGIEYADEAQMRDAATGIDVLFLTVTEEERDALLAVMKPLPGQTAILQGSISETSYRFGRVGRYRCAQVESTVGATGRHGATLKSKTALDELKPKAFILLGIAFGVDRKKQRLGDVIVAETVFPYEYQRVSENSVTSRGTGMQCGFYLSERFRTRRLGWKKMLGNRQVKVFQGQMLSGNKLVDNKQFRDDLLKTHSEARGGEMEGEGGYAAAEQAKIEKILVKSICDWADGHKNDNAHSFAAFTAVSLVEYILNQPDVLAVLGATDVVKEDNIESAGIKKSSANVIHIDNSKTSSNNEESLPQKAEASPVEQLTELFANDPNIYKAKKIVTKEVRSLVDQLNSLDSLKKNYPLRDIELEEFLKTSEILSFDTLNLFAIGAYEGDSSYCNIWSEALTILAERTAPQRTVDNIRHYATLLHFYAFGIGAVRSKNYEVLAALFSQSVIKNNVYNDLTDKAGYSLVPYRVIKEESVRSLPNGKSHKTPFNRRLYETLRPYFEEFIFDENAFLETFARFEYLFALAAAHEQLKINGAIAVPVGSYGWELMLRRSQTGGKLWVWEEIDQEIEQEPEQWTKFVRKAFQMPLDNFKEFKLKADEGVQKAIRIMWHDGLIFHKHR
jgi:nucleoside phosphorylase